MDRQGRLDEPSFVLLPLTETWKVAPVLVGTLAPLLVGALASPLPLDVVGGGVVLVDGVGVDGGAVGTVVGVGAGTGGGADAGVVLGAGDGDVELDPVVDDDPDEDGAGADGGALPVDGAGGAGGGDDDGGGVVGVDAVTAPSSVGPMSMPAPRGRAPPK
jgi:hypothetical protein